MRFGSWKLRFALMMAVVLGIAMLAGTIDAPTVSPTAQAEAAMAAGDCAEQVAAADVAYAVERGQSEDLVEQAAICLLIPPCSRNSDCDPQCGDGQGRCVHNPCPARICRCR